MKMELIASLLHKPEVMLLDEPTIGLDLISQQRIRDFLKSYNRDTKTTVLLTSHYTSDIRDLCARTVVINNGELVYDGALEDIGGVLGRKKLIKIVFDDGVREAQGLSQYGIVRSHEGSKA
jgi:ABC-2 type transport system ATP-binding protein